MSLRRRVCPQGSLTSVVVTRLDGLKNVAKPRRRTTRAGSAGSPIPSRTAATRATVPGSRVGACLGMWVERRLLPFMAIWTMNEENEVTSPALERTYVFAPDSVLSAVAGLLYLLANV